MKYTSGNYHAFARAKKKKGAENIHAHIIGSGLSSLAAAAFMVRDGYVPGENIHIYEKSEKAGGACHAYNDGEEGFVLAGGRELDPHFEVLWDLLKGIPSLDTEGASVFDEIYWISEEHQPKCNVMATSERGEVLHTDFKFNLSDKAIGQVIKLFMMPTEQLYDKKISDIWDKEVLESNFWMYWGNIYAFDENHSALELKKYLQRFIYDLDSITDQSNTKTYKYSAYESMILPIVEYLKSKGVKFRYGTSVNDVEFDITPESKKVTKLTLDNNGNIEEVAIGENTFVFITNGGSAENISVGGQNKRAYTVKEVKSGGGWELWKKIANKDVSFGNPGKFFDEKTSSKWVTATITTLDERISYYIKSIVRRDPFGGEPISGGNVTIKDSAWGINWSFGLQPQFKAQKDGQLVGWMYGATPDNEGNYVKKKMEECTGVEICMEWLYHMGVEEGKIEELAREAAITVPAILPFITSYFVPRAEGDRPLVVPEGSENFAFIGQFTMTDRDTIFTTEYSVRTAMEAVYRLMNIERGIPEVWNAAFDIRCILTAFANLTDGRYITDINLSSKEKKFIKELIKLAENSEFYNWMERYGVI